MAARARLLDSNTFFCAVFPGGWSDRITRALESFPSFRGDVVNFPNWESRKLKQHRAHFLSSRRRPGRATQAARQGWKIAARKRKTKMYRLCHEAPQTAATLQLAGKLSKRKLPSPGPKLIRSKRGNAEPKHNLDQS